jgi:hypothetical protein
VQYYRTQYCLAGTIERIRRYLKIFARTVQILRCPKVHVVYSESCTLLCCLRLTINAVVGYQKDADMQGGFFSFQNSGVKYTSREKPDDKLKSQKIYD